MPLTNCCLLVTGAEGFIGKNLRIRLDELQDVTVRSFLRGDDVTSLPSLLGQVDAVIHLAGENRPEDVSMFEEVNSKLTSSLCDAIRLELLDTGRKVPMVITSSTQAEQDNPYGRSKLAAEAAVRRLAEETSNPCVILRLPGVFGKWCKPNYNSVVATFCNNIARGLSTNVDNPTSPLRLVHVDDVVSSILAAVEDAKEGVSNLRVEPEYETTVGDLHTHIQSFDNCRSKLFVDRVGEGFVRALYSTYISYLPNEEFGYEVPKYVDPRGVFVEMLKTPDCGQFSYFTAHPGVTRGGHYHHTKTEKFLVIKGRAHFRFRNLLTEELVELQTEGCHPQVVDTVPGWTHDITNVGDEEMVVMLWANENFDRDKPDTIAGEI